MKAKKILFATDFSSPSESAMTLATSLARDSQAMLLIVHVQEPREQFADSGYGSYPREDEATLQKRLEDVKPADSQIGCSRRLLSGRPAEEIVRCAEEESATMIVVGSHGRTGLARVLLGSVAEEIVRSAACPVLTVKTQVRNQEPSPAT